MNAPARKYPDVVFLPDMPVDSNVVCCHEGCPIIDLHLAHHIPTRRGPKIRAGKKRS